MNYNKDNKIAYNYNKNIVNYKKRINNENSRSYPMRAVCFTLIAAMILRLFFASSFWQLNIDLGHVYPLFSLPYGIGLIDGNYAPIFLVHLVWIFYVLYFYERILAYLDPVITDKSRGLPYLMKFLSCIVVFNMCACVIVAMFYPSIWVASIGWGGLIVGLRTFIITRVYKKDLNDAARKKVFRYGFLTIVLSALIFFVGIIAVAAVINYNFASLQTEWLFVSWVLCVILFITGWILRGEHVSPGAASNILGLLARPKNPNLPNISD